MEIIPSDNRSLCTSYVSGNVTIEIGKVFDDHAGGPFHWCATWGQAIWNVTHSDRLALLLSWPSDDVHRELQRSTAIDRGNREKKKPTENAQKWRVYISTHQVPLPPVLNSGDELLYIFQLPFFVHICFLSHACSHTVYTIVYVQHGPSSVAWTIAIMHTLRNRLACSILRLLTHDDYVPHTRTHT